MVEGLLRYGRRMMHLRSISTRSKGGLSIKIEQETFISRDDASRMVHECLKLQDIELGRRVQFLILYNGLDYIAYFHNHLIRLFVSIGCWVEANQAFCKVLTPDDHTWNAIINAHAKIGESQLAIYLYFSMQNQGFKSNQFIIPSILKACSSMGSVAQIRNVHEHIYESGMEFDYVVESALVHMYAKCGSLEEARSIFYRLPNRNVVLWGAMIEGHTQHGKDELALDYFEKMQQEGIEPDRVAYMSALKACGNIGALQQGRGIHDEIVENGLRSDIAVGCSLVDMYAKCGSLADAQGVFMRLPTLDPVFWNAMITGYAQNGEAFLAVRCFQDMQVCGIKPDDVAFTGILTAFSQSGLEEEALKYFKHMTEIYNILPNVYHITCMVDVLGRVGQLSDAEELLKQTLHHDICLWMTLLNACNMHCHVEIGKRCFNSIVKLDPYYVPAYCLMANIYGNAHMEKDAYRLAMLSIKLHRCMEETWTDFKHEVYAFEISQN